MGLADDLTEAMRPMAEQGNPYATLNLFRLQMSEEPDVTAQQIIEEWKVLAQYVAAIIKELTPLLEWWRDTMGPN